MLKVRIPRHVHYRAYEHGGVVLINTATGHWHALNPTAGRLWASWAQGADFERSVAEISARHPGVAPEQIHEDAVNLLHDLLRRGLVGTGARGSTRPRSAPSREAADATMSLDHDLRPGWGAALLAWCCLVLAVLLLVLPFRVTAAVVGWIRGVARRRDMSTAWAEAAAHAIRRAARRYPGRAACLETSLATVLFAAASLRHLDWCLGAATDPYRFHAWVELGGHPIAADSAYLRVLTI